MIQCLLPRYLKIEIKVSNGFFTGFVLGIAFALIPTSIIGFILNERVNALVHQQIISGMNKFSYWVSNFLFDLVKVFVPVLFAIAFLVYLWFGYKLCVVATSINTYSFSAIYIRYLLLVH